MYECTTCGKDFDPYNIGEEHFRLETHLCGSCLFEQKEAKECVHNAEIGGK